MFGSESVRLAKEDQHTYETRFKGNLVHPSPRYTLIDLFCGAGGMTLGFSGKFSHPFVPIWANDFNKFCVETYNKNFGAHCIYGDIVDILKDGKVQIPSADVVIGGPPCQGFSLLNKQKSGDPRKQLWRPFLEVVQRCNARIFVMENVPQLIGTLEHEEIVSTAESLGFKVRHGKLMAADFGAPQQRLRAFIIGCRFADPSPLFPPRKTHYNPNLGGIQIDFATYGDDAYLRKPQPWKTVRNAIGDLPPPEGTEIRSARPPLDLHFGRNPTEKSMRRYRAIPEQGMNRFDLQRIAPELTPDCWHRKKEGGTDLFGRLWWDNERGWKAPFCQ